MSRLVRCLLLSVLLAPTLGRADATITIDGNASDWPATSPCFTEPSGDTSGSGIDLQRVCVENNNTTGNAGYLYVLYDATAALPNGTTYFGFVFDNDNDGTIESTDRAYALRFEGSNTTPTALDLFQATDFTYVSSYTSTASCGGSGTANGWSGRKNGDIVEFRIAYGCLGLSAGNDNRLITVGVYPNFDLTYPAYYNGSASTLVAEGPAPDVINFTTLSGSARATLAWTNPSSHDGVVVLRSTGAVPNTVPTDGVTYAVGNTVGNAQVVYVNLGTATTFTNTGLTNGTTYYYKIYNHHQFRTYSYGSAGTPTGLTAVPTNRVHPNPQWCYATGAYMTQQPTVRDSVGIYTGSNLGAITYNQLSTDLSLDGNERYRPVSLTGTIGARFPIVPLKNRTSTYILSGDSGGNAYVIDSETGAILINVATTATNIQAQPGVQLYDYANSAFQTAHPNRDLIFVSSRKSSATTNSVTAVSSTDGAIRWTFQPNNMDIVSGGPLTEYSNNRLWVGSKSNSGTQASVRVLNTATTAAAGAEIARFTGLGDVDYGVVKDFQANQAFVTGYVASTNTTLITGIDLAFTGTGNNPANAIKWQVTISGAAPSSYAFPTDTSFIIPLKNGQVRRYSTATGVTTPTVLKWTRTLTNPGGTTVIPTGVTLDYYGKVYVGDSDGRVHRLNEISGADETQFRVANARLGTPTLEFGPSPNYTPLRVVVGTEDGRLCAYGLPLP